MKMKVEVDEQEVIGNIGTVELFEMAGIDTPECKEQFGDKLFREFTESEVIAYYGEVELLNEIGKATAIEYFGINVAE